MTRHGRRDGHQGDFPDIFKQALKKEEQETEEENDNDNVIPLESEIINENIQSEAERAPQTVLQTQLNSIVAADKEFDSDDDSVIRKKITTTEVCGQRKNENEINIPCDNPIKISSAGEPGYTKVCVEVDAFPCATIDDITKALDVDFPADSTVVEDNISISVNEGSKSGSACVKYHTKDDLKGDC